MCCIYIVEYYSAIKKNEIMAFAGKWMKLETIVLSEISQTQSQNSNIFSDKQMMIYNERGQQGKEKNEGTLDGVEENGVGGVEAGKIVE